MSARTPRRVMLLGGALALVAPVALVAGLSSPAGAGSPKTHHVKLYKVEAHVDLGGEFPDNALHTHLSCKAGDYALDGMWRVDHVDQANPDTGTTGDERDVQVDASYGDDVDAAKWHFRFLNNATGDAQLKIFLTCVDSSTENQHAHSHTVVLSNRMDDSSNTGVGTVPAGPASLTHDTNCAAGELAVAPGFEFINGTSGRIFRSWPASSSFLSWQWAFLVSAPAEVNLYLRCLRIKTGSAGAGPHAHNLQTGWFPGYGGSQADVAVSTTAERQYSCDADKVKDKGMVAGFWIDDPAHVWWLGMDPRPKIRSFRFWNDGGGSSSTYVALLCIGTRTGKQIAP